MLEMHSHLFFWFCFGNEKKKLIFLIKKRELHFVVVVVCILHCILKLYYINIYIYKSKKYAEAKLNKEEEKRIFLFLFFNAKKILIAGLTNSICKFSFD